MRTIIAVILFLGTCYLQVVGQGVLQKEIDQFSVQDISLEEALYQLMELAQVSISFHNADIPQKNIHVKLQHTTVGQVLQRLLHDTPLEIQLLGNQIILTKRPRVQWYTISGYVEDRQSGEHLTGAYVYDPKRQIGTISNEYGFFSLHLPEGTTTLVISYLGYRPEEILLDVQTHTRIHISLQPSLTLREIVITARDSLHTPFVNPEQTIESHLLKILPSMGGEPDVIRTTHLLPGVQTGADGADGIHVRGGSYDQNLIMLDGVPLYNPFHAFGAFSIFNTQAIRRATFIKSGFPARYGGRLSSILDLRTREGDMRRWRGGAELSVIAAKMWIEGPIVKDRMAIFFSTRKSLLNTYLPALSRKQKEAQSQQDVARYYEQTGATQLTFEDLNAKLHTRLGANDHLYFSFYRGADYFEDLTKALRDERYIDTLTQTNFVFRDSIRYQDQLNWGTTLFSMRWNHIFSNRLFAHTTFFWSRYRQQSTNLDYISERIILPIQGPFQRQLTILQSNSFIDDLGARLDLEFFPSSRHRYRMGMQWIHHQFQPRVRAVDIKGEFVGVPIEEISSDTLALLPSVEGSVWIEDVWQLTPKWQLHWGLHSSSFFVERVNYIDLQPRLSLQFAPSAHWLFRFDLTRMVQYLHLLRTSNIALPNDLWISATADFGPQYALQTSGGLVWHGKKGWQVTLDTYHNWTTGLLTLQEGGSLSAWRSSVSVGQGNSYGIELLVRKRTGPLSGWVGYTWSRTSRRFDERVNFGQPFPYRYDRRHDIKMALIWAITDKVQCAVDWVYGTGLAVSLPLSRYSVTFPGFASSPLQAYVIENKNGERLPAYHRLDLNINLHLAGQLLNHNLKLGVYNVYNRVNPLYYAVRTEFTGTLGIDRKEVTKLTQVALIPFLPYLNYAISF